MMIHGLFFPLAIDCDKDGIRRSVGHHCSFRVHLKMFSNDIGKWEVSTQGHHVPPHETWEPPQNKSVLRDPRVSWYNKNILSNSALFDSSLSEQSVLKS